MPLNDIQARFKDLMLTPSNAQAMDDIFESGRIPLDERLKIYRSNIIGSLSDVMKANFPIIGALVGEDFMNATARLFVTHRPPQGGCLNEYGAEFAAFLEEFEPAQSLPYLPDVARFEWAKNLSYYARDDEALRAEDLAAIAPDALSDTILKLHDHVNLLSSDYPLTAIASFCEKTDANNDETLDIDQGGVQLMIHRADFKVKVLELDDPEFIMLRTLEKETTLGDAVEQVLSMHNNFDFQAFLQKHLSLETFLTVSSNK